MNDLHLFILFLSLCLGRCLVSDESRKYPMWLKPSYVFISSNLFNKQTKLLQFNFLAFSFPTDGNVVVDVEIAGVSASTNAWV